MIYILIFFQQKIGELRGFKISGAVASNPDRVSGLSAVFQLFCPSHPVDFNFRFIRPKNDKIDLQSKLIVANKEFVTASINAEGDNNDGKNNQILVNKVYQGL